MREGENVEFCGVRIPCGGTRKKSTLLFLLFPFSVPLCKFIGDRPARRFLARG